MGAKKTSPLRIGIVAAAVFGITAIASATFPGRNGRIAFSDGTDIFTMNSDGSDVRQLTSVGPANSTCCFEWSADGRSIAYSLSPADGSTSQLWIMNADGSNQHLLFDDPDGLDVAPSFSPDGNYVAFTRCPLTIPNANCVIARIRSDGTDLTSITQQGTDPDVADLDPVYSPDGAMIAFGNVTRGGLIEALYLVNADGSNLRVFTPPLDGPAKPDWEPDGRRVAFQTGFFYAGDIPPCIGDSTIRSIRLDGGGDEPLTGSPGFSDSYPSFSPQQDALVFARTDAQGDSSIYVLDLGHSGAVPTLVHRSAARRAPRPSALIRGPKSKNGRAPHPIESGGTSPRWGASP